MFSPLKNTLEDVRNWLDSRTDIEITNLSTDLTKKKKLKLYTLGNKLLIPNEFILLNLKHLIPTSHKITQV
ncbi:hypothetical protein J14TS5_50440 [Paenibacillus lautus]|nr:hypothetical protein J14TS5_50440 [Paenibacillus lautus]